jgi:hypothetical protein
MNGNAACLDSSNTCWSNNGIALMGFFSDFVQECGFSRARFSREKYMLVGEMD